MLIGLIVIGDEILWGRTRDTNTAWLGRYLFSQNLSLHFALSVGDHPQSIKTALHFMLAKVDIIITSGGLGPTRDDITKQVLADTFHTPLKECTKARAMAEANYNSRGKNWNPQSNHYHLIPKGFSPIHNPVGLAPGLSFQKDNNLILAGPGVPREFQSMFSTEFCPLIKNLSGFKEEFSRLTIRTTGLSEEDLFYNLAPDLWDQLRIFGKISSLPHPTGIDILITLQGTKADIKKKEQQIRSVLKKSPLYPSIWSWSDQSTEESIVEKAREKNLTFCFAESCTGGLAASRITDIPGSSDVFLGSFVTYSNQLKKSILGVQEKTLLNYGAVSVPTANEMAQLAREKSNAHMALAFSGIAGPGGGSKSKPVGTVVISLATKNGVDGRPYRFQGERQQLKQYFAQMGLFLLHQQLKDKGQGLL